MNDALIAGNLDAALIHLTEAARLKYQRVFEALLPQMPAIIASYSRPLLSFDGARFAEYYVLRPALPGSQERVIYAIQFVRDEAGRWKLDSM
jgi:hypothetical protein